MTDRIQQKRAIEIAPRPDRYLAVGALRGLDRGAPMIRDYDPKRYVTENGWESAVYVVCCRFWILTVVPLVLLNVISDSLDHRGHLTTWVRRFVFIMMLVLLFMACLRLWNAFRLSRRFRRENPQPPNSSPPTPCS